MNKFVLGIDFGTESGRAALVSVSDGSQAATHTTAYTQGVIDERLPGSDQSLGPEWALQDPQDYLHVLRTSVPKVMEIAGIDSSQVVGIGISFTASTILPVDGEGTPLCMHKEYRDNPHSWVKLWKHHAAAKEAEEVTRRAAERNEKFLKRYGSTISSEWMVPKVLQILHEAPEVYKAAVGFLEAADWVTFVLTGIVNRSSCGAGYKAMWHDMDGYPDEDFFAAVHPDMKDFVKTKLTGPVLPVGSAAGGLTAHFSKELGLYPGTPVATSIIDAHAAMVGTGVVNPGRMVVVMGTSTCHMLLDEHETPVQGIAGVVKNGIVPELYGYEAGQAAVGDIFGWFIKRQVPVYVEEAAKQENLSVHQWLEQKASSYQPGETGLLALDWWNGNRSVLVNPELSGLIVGYTLATKPEEIYRTLLEATAYGTRKIIDAFEEQGVRVEEIYAGGGLPLRNSLLMQIYADVTGRQIKVPKFSETSALGAAVLGAVAAGKESGGYSDIKAAVENMCRHDYMTYSPIPGNVQIYDELYEGYLRLHDYFGTGENTVMAKLKERKRSTR